MPSNSLRIIGGIWRSRHITVLEAAGLRPTPNRVRETVFNWLSPYIHDAVCLDAFAGSGALGFEALSRGAKSVTLVEKNKQVAQQLAKNKQLLNAENAYVINANFLQYHFSEQAKFNLVFLDPPFNHDMLQKSFDCLPALLAEHALVYVEVEVKSGLLCVPESWHLLKEKIAGEVRYCLYEVNPLPHS